MLLAIIALADKVFNVLGVALGWIKERSDASRVKRDIAQASMDDSAKKGDFEAWKAARHRRDNA
jgi:hypothetical protein